VTHIVGHRIDHFHGEGLSSDVEGGHAHLGDVDLQIAHQLVLLDLGGDLVDVVGEGVGGWTTVLTVELDAEVVLGTTGIVGSGEHNAT